jgi:CMP-N,N'-diacetyllegionaminic acid synthase
MTSKKQFTTTAILTGRGGNTLPDKNIIPVLGKPLLYYPARAAYESKLITNYCVSSDCDKILKSAQNIGYSPIKRPSKYSQPDSQHEDVIRHALDVLKERGDLPDIIVVLLANSVTTKTKWIDDCLEMIMEDDSITSVAPVYLNSDFHPFRAKKINKDGFFEPFFDFEDKYVSTNRQDLEPSYFFCHNFWVLRTSNFNKESVGQKPWTFMGNKIKPYVLVEKTFDVHEIEDVAQSEQWLMDQNDI